MQKRIFAILLAIVLIFTMMGCSAKNKTENGDTSNPVTTGDPAASGTGENTGAIENEISGTSYPVTITDSYGRTVTIEKEPNRIISGAPNITETIYALGLADKLVGRTDFCDFPEDTKDIESIGYIDEPSVEKIAELKPDIVIASSIVKKEIVQKLEEININVILFKEEGDFDGVYQSIKNIGMILNVQNKADAVVEEMKNKVKEVADKVSGRPVPSVYYVVGFGQYGDFTAGKGTFIGQMIEMAGGKNVADDVEGWQYSLEKLIEKDPDILICSKYFDSKQGIKDSNGYKDLRAVKEDRLFEIDNNMLDRQSPRLADGLVELAKTIHPDAFK